MRLKDIFATALEIGSEAEREAYLAQVCGEDQDLRSEVESLLAAHAAADGFLTRAVSNGHDFAEQHVPAERTATQIGPYKIREKIAEGGMGVVYVAEQLRPLRRKVALKVIKPGMGSREVVARFEAERQALALMNHPNVARVLDAGTTDEGLPFFAMELVRGISITEYCDEARLGTRERLQLFVTICHAVQHAHQKGIIHRDLKPGNVLVTLHDGVPVPKVIDFGVAKALNQRLTEQTIYTQFRQMVGTPTYMSPEQAEMSGLDVDTRTDVYSLGVLLYELLTGTTPFDKQTLLSRGFDEMRRVIREDEPPRPSHRISTLDAAAKTTLYSRRGIDARELSHSLQRELDWIVMKALEKDRNRRYESASTLAQDVQRYLSDEPVQACPASLGYRLRKYGKRHIGLLMTVALVLITATVGTAVSLVYASQASIAQADAEQRAQEAHEATHWSQTLLYAADMKLASDAIANQDLPRARELLERHIPIAGEPDHRGFEWHLLQKHVVQSPDLSLEQGAWVDDVEFSPDGQWLATTAAMGTVNVYITATWKKYRSFPTTSNSVNGLAWSPDGHLLAAACADGSVPVWDVTNASQRWCVSAHEGGANDVVFSPDGRHLYSSGDDHLAVKWGVDTGEQQLVFRGHSREVERIGLAPDGKGLATSGELFFALWDTTTAKRLHTFRYDHSRINCVAFSPDGRFVAAGDIAGYVYLADPETGKSQTLTRQIDGIEALTFFAGQWLATADRGGAIQLHRMPLSLDEIDESWATQSPRWIAHEGRALSIAASTDGRSLVSGGRDSLVRLWTPNLQERRWSLGSHYLDMAVGPANRLYAAGHKIHVFDLAERRLVDVFAPADPPWKRIDCTADGRFLAAVRVGELALFELASGQRVRTWPLDEQLDPHRLAVSSDGGMIALAEYTDRDFVFLYRTVGQSSPVRLPAQQCYALAFSPDGRLLASNHLDDLRLFDLEARGEPRVVKGHTNALFSVAFSPDGRLLATASHDRLLKAWRLDTAEEVFSVVAHRDRVMSVSFAPDGKTIATGSEDGSVKLWHTATGQPLGTLPSERQGVRKLCFNGSHQLCAYLDGGTVLIHEASALPRTHTDVVAPEAPIDDDTAEFRGLGDLPGGDDSSVAEGISSDGQFVVGHSRTEAGFDPFLWTSQGGMRSFGRPRRKTGNGQASRVSDDGRILCGANTKPGQPWAATLWIGEQPSIAIAPPWSMAEGMSADGSAVVGYQHVEDTFSAFHWRSGETQLLQTSSQHRHSIARAVTRDGALALGMVFNTAGSRPKREDHSIVRNACPVIWDSQGLHLLPGFDPSYNWWPYDLSDDGSVVVGLCWKQPSESSEPVGTHKKWAFVWRSGQVALLDPPPGYSGGNARRVSGDGRVVVGYSNKPTTANRGQVAWIWDTVHGVRNLKELLARHGLALDWQLYDAIDLSQDCRTVLGSGINPAGHREAWLARLPAEVFEPNGAGKRQP